MYQKQKHNFSKKACWQSHVIGASAFWNILRAKMFQNALAPITWL
jgi:hypothetical protein